MIIVENLTINGKPFVHHYSDTGMKILQVETGVVYCDAVDVVPCRYTYTETDEPIEVEEEPIEEEQL